MNSTSSSLPTLRQNIFLIGNIDTQIHGNKLSSKLQVLQVLFFHLRERNLSLQDAIMLVIKEVIVFWEKVRLPTQKLYRCADKLESLYREWRNLQKNAGKPFNVQKENDFTFELNNLFDIAHGNIFEKVDKTRKEFLLNQRKSGRSGYIGNIEKIYNIQERTQLERKLNLRKRLKKSEDETDLLNQIVELEFTDSETLQTLSQNSIDTYSNLVEIPDHFFLNGDASKTRPSTAKRLRGTVNIIDEKVATVLDACKLSDRAAVHLITAIAQSLNFDVNSLVINKTSVHNSRQELRALKAKNIKKIFQDIELNAIVLHWDGKMLPNLMKREILDRLPVVITNNDVEKLLGIPELENGTGAAQANVIYEILEEWGLSNIIKAICCDTTPSNLGQLKGAAVLLEKQLEKNLLYLPCRHHIFEIILRSVFESKMPATNGPNIVLFKRFKDAWPKLDQSKYKIGLENEKVKKILESRAEHINSFAKETLKNTQLRGDYRELLELSQLFLGFIPSCGIKLRYPGAFHHARWMAKAIYSLKIYLFRDTFKLTSNEERNLADICIFILVVYLEAWFTAPFASRAPYHDLQFVKKLYAFQAIDSVISRITLQKFSCHLWYLSPEAAAMAFFDETLSDDIKRKMILELNGPRDYTDSCRKQFHISFKDIDILCNKEMDHFITSQSTIFFERFGINTKFLDSDPTLWSQDKNFNQGLNIVKKLSVVNDCAERAVQLMEQYNNILTTNESQKQFILQTISEYRKIIPDSRKCTVIKDF